MYISAPVELYKEKKGRVKVKIQTMNLRYLKKGFLDQTGEKWKGRLRVEF